jgi:hypothetical protein
VLSPVIAIGFAFSRWPHAGPGIWLAFVPLAIVWMALLDLRWGVSARLPHRRRPRNGSRPESNG